MAGRSQHMNLDLGWVASPPHLTLTSSLLSGKAVWPLVSKPQMTVSCGQLTKGVQVESVLGTWSPRPPHV